MRRDEEGAQRWGAHPLRRRVLFSGFYSQKGESLLPSGGRFWVLDNLFTGVVAPTTCKGRWFGRISKNRVGGLDVF